MQKTGILFLDWDGTLSDGRFWSSLDQDAYKKIQCSLFEQNKALIDSWMMGNESSETVCDWLKLSPGLHQCDLFGSLIDSCEHMAISKIAIDLIERIKEDRYVVLMTDNMDCFSRFTVPAQRLTDLFDEIVNSSEVKRLKKDGGGLSFQQIRQKYDVPFSACRLIDDSEKTCLLFQKLGGLVHRTTGIRKTEEILRSLCRSKE